MRKKLIWLFALTLVTLSGLPYAGYLAVRNKFLAHHKWMHIHPDDVVHVRLLGLIGRMDGGLNFAIYLANPGGTIYVPEGSFPQNAAFAAKSNLNLIGSGRGQADGAGCVTTLTTTMTSGDLFAFLNMTDVHMSDFCIVNNGIGSSGAAIRLDYGQRIVVERLYISGPFTQGIVLHTSSTSTGSTIRNDFRDIFITGLQTGGIGCLLDSSDATSKVINSNTFWMVACQGGTNGIGVKVTNTNTTQNINENFFYGDEFASGGSGGSGTGILFSATATRGMTFISPNVESNGTGLNKGNQNTVTFLGGNFSSNGTNVTDAQPQFTHFIGTNVGGTTQQFSIAPDGGMDVNCIGVNASCTGNTVNVNSGTPIQAAGAAQAFVDSTGFRLRSVTFASLPASANGTAIFCSDCNATCTVGGGTGRTCFRENGAWTH